MSGPGTLIVNGQLLVNGARLLADASGALLWPERGLLAVADLHLEKGSSFATRGRLLPPYDSAATLQRIATLVERHRPKIVVALGDSFHDAGAGGRLSRGDGERLAALTAGLDWIWIVGNHDPEPPRGFGGRVAAELVEGPLLFRHQAHPKGASGGEVSGHYHPRATVRLPARSVSARCFVTDGRRVILPAFGAYTGGLDARDPAISRLFPRGFSAFLLGARGVYGYPSGALG